MTDLKKTAASFRAISDADLEAMFRKTQEPMIGIEWRYDMVRLVAEVKTLTQALKEALGEAS